MKELMQKSTNLGMHTFDQSLYDLYLKGDISYKDAIHHSDHPNELRLMIKLGKEKNGSTAARAQLSGITLINPED